VIASGPKDHPVEPPDGPLIDEAEVRRSLANEVALAPQLQGSAKAGADSFGRTQGLIATSIVGLFVAIVVVLTFAYLLAPFLSAAERITAGADKARELANTLLLLPIVTLVLGYYFGKRSD